MSNSREHELGSHAVTVIVNAMVGAVHDVLSRKTFGCWRSTGPCVHLHGERSAELRDINALTDDTADHAAERLGRWS